MRLTRRYEKMTPEKRPQDPSMDGTGLTFETLERGGEYPDTMPQVIRPTDAEGRSWRLEDPVADCLPNRASTDCRAIFGSSEIGRVPCPRRRQCDAARLFDMIRWLSSIPFHRVLVRLRRLPALVWLWASHFMVTGGDHER